MGRIRRLSCLVVVVAVVVACAGDGNGNGSGEPGAADEAPIAIGFLGELSGPFAIWGVPARNGMRLAVDELNADGGVDGRQLELFERDTQGVPEEGVTALRELIERRGVVTAAGLVSSDVALAASRIAEEESVPLLLVMAGSDRILTEQSEMTFRTCLPAASRIVEPIVAYLQEEGITRVGAVVADYEWGRAVEEALVEAVGSLPEVDLIIEVAPVQENEFTPYLRRFEELDPELIVGTGHPPGAMALTRQAGELGFDATVTGSNSPAVSVMAEVGEAAYGRYLDIACADYQDERYQELAVRYHDAFDGFMEDASIAGYGHVLMVAEAIEQTGSDDPTDIAAYLHETTFDLPGYAWPLAFTANGDLDDAEPLLTFLQEGPPPEGVNPGASWYPEVVFRSPPLSPAAP